MPRHFIVSNRLPVTVARNTDKSIAITRSSGGLVAGLEKVFTTGDSYWIGHNGVFRNESGYNDLCRELQDQRLISVPLTKRAYTSYYSGLSNGAIWPLFHYFPNSVRFATEDWVAYQEVNDAFLRTILEVAEAGDYVWVHDYHLMLLPNLLRRERPNLRIAYFHHIPFPSSEMFRILPIRRAVLYGLLGSDLIGFHTLDYVRHFLTSVSRLLGDETHVDQIHHQGRLVKVGAFPLGIDFDRMDRLSAAAQSEASWKSSDTLLFLGIDRLDYTKGIPERLMAFRDFLREWPEYVGKVTFVQLSVPSRSDIASYGNLRSTVERLVGQINGEFGRPGYVPVQYLYRALPAEEVAALYAQADVAVITPLRDGLNLVCKEFVAAKRSLDGVLILSEFAGSASEMGEALTVNPFDTRDVAYAMYRAVTMPDAEKRSRMQLLRERVRMFDNMSWSQSILDAWKQTEHKPQAEAEKLEGHNRTQLVQRAVDARRVFVFLDNDGTMIPIRSRPELAVPSREVIDHLRTITAAPGIAVTIVTGRPRTYCDRYYGELPLRMVAEHGAFIKEMPDAGWQQQPGCEEFEVLKPHILNLLNMSVRCVPGTHVEEKETCLVWHYRQAEPQFAASQAKALVDDLHQLLSNTSLVVQTGKKSVEVRLVVANKGYALEYFAEHDRISDDDLVVTLGDDTTDEDMHRLVGDRGFAIHVGKPSLHAPHYLVRQEDVFPLLEEIVAARANAHVPTSGRVDATRVAAEDRSPEET